MKLCEWCFGDAADECPPSRKMSLTPRRYRLECRRVSFPCHRDTLALIERAMGESNRTKTEVIVDTLHEARRLHLEYEAKYGPISPDLRALLFQFPRRRPRLEGRRVSFLCHRDLIEDLERAMGESNRSKAEVIVDTLRFHLQPPGP